MLFPLAVFFSFIKTTALNTNSMYSHYLLPTRLMSTLLKGIFILSRYMQHSLSRWLCQWNACHISMRLAFRFPEQSEIPALLKWDGRRILTSSWKKLGQQARTLSQSGWRQGRHYSLAFAGTHKPELLCTYIQIYWQTDAYIHTQLSKS